MVPRRIVKDSSLFFNLANNIFAFLDMQHKRTKDQRPNLLFSLLFEASYRKEKLVVLLSCCIHQYLVHFEFLQSFYILVYLLYLVLLYAVKIIFCLDISSEFSLYLCFFFFFHFFPAILLPCPAAMHLQSPCSVSSASACH